MSHCWGRCPPLPLQGDHLTNPQFGVGSQEHYVLGATLTGALAAVEPVDLGVGVGVALLPCRGLIDGSPHFSEQTRVGRPRLPQDGVEATAAASLTLAVASLKRPFKLRAHALLSRCSEFTLHYDSRSSLGPIQWAVEVCLEMSAPCKAP